MAAVRRRVQQNQVPLILDDFICSICREIFKLPHQLPCSHIFCTECLQQCQGTRLNSHDHSCPCCRRNYSPQHGRVAHDVAEKLRCGTAECRNCNEMIPLRNMQKHLDQCDQMRLDESVSNALHEAFPSASRKASKRTGNLPVATGVGALQKQRQSNVKQVPGTFNCPYCNTKRLGRESLLQHVQQQHKGADPNVVCPICSAMPWGDPTQKSQNFPQHLQLRHRFDYDMFVDMTKDDDTVYQEIVKRSMYDQGRFY